MKAVGEEVPLFRPEGAGRERGTQLGARGGRARSRSGLRGAGARDTEEARQPNSQEPHSGACGRGAGGHAGGGQAA